MQRVPTQLSNRSSDMIRKVYRTYPKNHKISFDFGHGIKELKRLCIYEQTDTRMMSLDQFFSVCNHFKQPKYGIQMI